MNEEISPVQQCLQETLNKATELEQLFKKLNGLTAQQLDECTNQPEYLEFLGNMLYSLNAVTHSYAHLRSKAVPKQFEDIKTEYNKIKEELAKKDDDKPASKINKDAVARIIKRTI